MANALDPFIQKILREVWGRRLLRPGARVVIAVSGGADSMALLHFFHSISKPLRLRVTAAHFDHMLRKNSQADARFVKEHCRELGIPVIAGRADVKLLSKKKQLSIEDAARRARYHFLVRTAERTGAKKIFTAHTRDDQVETVLLHVIRGAGLEGASGMAWEGPVQAGQRTSVKLCRPFLGVLKRDIEDFLNRLKVAWREDLSNRNLRFKRNRVRRELIPSLMRFNPAVVDRLAEFTEIIGEERVFLERETQKALVRCRFRITRNGISVRTQAFNHLPTAVKQELFRRAIQKLKGATGGFGYRHWKLFEAWLSNPKRRRPLEMPRGVQIRKQEGHIFFSLWTPARKIRSVFVRRPVSGETRFGEWAVRFRVERRSRKWGARSSPRQTILDLEKVRFPLCIRARKAGDRFIPIGMKKSKKLQDFFVDSKVPFEKRDRIPIFTDRKGIIWVGGLRPADPVKVTSQTNRVLRISLSQRPASKLTPANSK